MSGSFSNPESVFLGVFADQLFQFETDKAFVSLLYEINIVT